jgi:hypothetical protein
MGFVMEKATLGQFYPSTSVSHANHHSTNFFIIIITLGWHNRPIGDPSTEWAQLGSNPPLYQLKEIDRGLSRFFQSLWAITRTLPRLSHENFLTNHFQLIIHQCFYHLMVFSLNIESVMPYRRRMLVLQDYYCNECV